MFVYICKEELVIVFVACRLGFLIFSNGGILITRTLCFSVSLQFSFFSLLQLLSVTLDYWVEYLYSFTIYLLLLFSSVLTPAPPGDLFTKNLCKM